MATNSQNKLKKVAVPKRSKSARKVNVNKANKSEDDVVVFCYNDIIELKDGRKGKIKFIGSLGYQSDIWFGLILSSPKGSHNGHKKNRIFWHCKPNHGTFVQRKNIKKVIVQRMGHRYSIHEKVKTPKGKAYIRFIGLIHSNTDKLEIEEYHEDSYKDDNQKIIYGVELIDQMGDNSGFINDEYIFSCAHFRGAFFTEEELVYIAPDAPPTPRISRKKRRKLKDRTKSKRKLKGKGKDGVTLQIAPELLGDDEIIGLDENNQSIDFDAEQEMSEEEDSDSITDSSSDEEYLTSSDMKRISLTSTQIDDRMSFARILSDFKHVQKTNVRSIAAKYEKMTTKQRFSTTQHEKSKEVELAQDVIVTAKRKRAETLPQNGLDRPTSPVYQPPRFADQLIETSKQFKSRKGSVPVPYKKALSTPMSFIDDHKGDDHDKSPPPGPMLKNQSQSVQTLGVGQAKFNKVQPPGRKKRSFRNKRKVQIDEVGYDGLSSPKELSPSTSLRDLHHDTHTIQEEPDMDQEEPVEDLNNIPHSRKQNKSRQSHENIQESPSKPTITKTTFSKLQSAEDSPKKPPPLTAIALDQHRSHAGSAGSDESARTDGYASPGIISPGGGMPSLQLQNSHSCEAENGDAVAVVDDMQHTNTNDTDKPYGPDVNVKESHLTSPRLTATGSNRALLAKQTYPKSPSAENVYSWVFKPADEKDKGDVTEFKLKERPDCPFDVCSTSKDFQRVCETLMLECNNPKNLFKVLKGICAKLKLPNPRYRRIDIKNQAVQKKLLKFEGAEDFLMLLGFKQTVHNPNFFVCDMDQPPKSVLEAAITVCNDCLLKCNHKRATIETIKKFSKTELHSHRKKKNKRGFKRKRSSRKIPATTTKPKNRTMGTLTENVETPSPSPEHLGVSQIKEEDENNLSAPNLYKTQLSVSVDGTLIRENEEKQNNITPRGDGMDMRNAQDAALAALAEYNSDNNNLELPVATLEVTNSIRMEDATETLDEFKFEQELDGDEDDRFQLSDIVWSITHKDYTEKDARAIILLCFPTFSSSQKLLKCLIERFFEPDESKMNAEETATSSTRRSSVSDTSIEDSDNHNVEVSSTFGSYLKADQNQQHKIESLWEVQVKVIQILKQWMNSYWKEDWDQNYVLLEAVDKFCEKIENCYTNDPAKDHQIGMTLVDMIHKTISKQEAVLESERRKNALNIRQGSVPMKFDRVSDMTSVIKKMRYDFVKIENRHLAEQITLLDFKYFKAIKHRECLGQAWKKGNKYEIAPNICALIDQFNKMSKWVQATILLAKNVKRRGRLIKKFIKISNELLALRNFQSLCAFHGALCSVPIHRLKNAWDRVPAKHRVRFEEMKVIFNTRNNMGHLRKLHREAHAPLVPYTGIFLSDLVLIEEGNKKHKDDGTVNFSKLMRLSNAIDNKLIYQRTTYEIADDPAIQALLLDDFKANDKLDADYMYKFSADVAKKDKPLRKKSKLSINFFNSKK